LTAPVRSTGAPLEDCLGQNTRLADSTPE
jgi:hypothetical protein